MLAVEVVTGGRTEARQVVDNQQELDLLLMRLEHSGVRYRAWDLTGEQTEPLCDNRAKFWFDRSGRYG
jgi:hypothetical protein